MKYDFILGTDVSKNWLNFCLMDKQMNLIAEWQIDNVVETIDLFFDQLLQIPGLHCLDQIWLVMEHTGIYVQHLTACAANKGLKTSLVPAIKISDALVGQTSFDHKTDAIDARRIAEYGIRFNDKLVLFQFGSDRLELIARLYTQRKRLQKAINLLAVPAAESKSFDAKDISDTIVSNQQGSIQALKKDFDSVEQQLEQLIMDQPELKTIFQQLISVDGIGKGIATMLILATEGFTKFTPDQAKAFAKFIGVVPLPKQSGKFKRKNKTSKRAFAKMKSILTMGVISLIKTDSDLGIYYHKKIAEGKHHLSVLNAMKNKLILRAFAVVRNQVKYDKNLNISLD